MEGGNLIHVGHVLHGEIAGDERGGDGVLFLAGHLLLRVERPHHLELRVAAAGRQRHPLAGDQSQRVGLREAGDREHVRVHVDIAGGGQSTATGVAERVGTARAAAVQVDVPVDVDDPGDRDRPGGRDGNAIPVEVSGGVGLTHLQVERPGDVEALVRQVIHVAGVVHPVDRRR